ncbi:protocadherin alpha-13-like isoform X4 [Lepisosteus oculatus]|uniref:protocadherin alpha-13-like isoform X4 n=1 Tax=Lepisosteus oculatus TaxID=7918 RepID=UPI0035F52557
MSFHFCFGGSMASLDHRYWMKMHFLFFLVPCLWDRISAQIIYTVLEEESEGTVVGNIAKDLSLLVQDLGKRRFEIVSGYKKRYFDVNLSNGLLIVKERIDREELCPSSLICSANLEAIVYNPLNVHRIKINIIDINDNSPVFPVERLQFNIAESTFPGAKFPLENAHDPDVGTNSINKYELSPNDYFTLDLQTDSKQGQSVELLLQKALDREKEPIVQLVLFALDGGKPTRSASAFITVNVLDVNDNAPVFSSPVYKVSVSENAPLGTVVIRLNATDADEGVNGEIVYTLINRGQKNILLYFRIDPDTGEIVVAGDLDFEEISFYELRVQAQDKGHTPSVTHCKVLVEVIDINDNAPEIRVTSLFNPIKEDAPSGTVIALITVSDIDSNKNGKVTPYITSKGPFRLKASYQNYYSLVLEGALDRESQSEHNIIVLARDEGVPPLSSTGVITIQVSDVNDNAPRFPKPVLDVYVKENSPPGTTIFSVSAMDLDLNENARITYYLPETSVKGVSASTVLIVNSVTGDICSMQTFDYEIVKTFQFQVQATDSGVPPQSSNVTVNVFILDENDNSPGILPPYDTDTDSVNIPYSADVGYFVAKIRAVDADSGYNALISYNLVEPKANNLFSIGTKTGEIRTRRHLTDSDSPHQALVILVKDHGAPPLSSTVSLTVLLVESSSEMQTELRQLPKKEYFTDLNLYLLISIISVSVIFLLTFLSLIVVKCHRRGDNLNSYVTPVVTAYPDGSWRYSQTQQYDVCLTSEASKSDLIIFNAPSPNMSGDTGTSSRTSSYKRPQQCASENESKPPNADWRYSASLRAGMQSSVHMEESAILQGAPGVLVQNWPTVSSATGGEPEGGEVSPPVGAGINSNSWSFRYGPGPGHPQALKPGEVPEAFIIPGSPAIISIRQDQPTGDDKSDFITFGKKEETKKKKKKKKGKADKKEKGNNDNSEQ